MGQKHLEYLKPHLRTASPGEVVIFDLQGIEATSASYFKATVIWLLKAAQRAAERAEDARLSGSEEQAVFDIFPMVANLASDVSEELQTVLESQQMCCLEAVAWDEHGVNRVRVRGLLDRAMRETLEFVAREKATTATALAKERNPPNVTGWNNRLADLFRLRLVRRTKEGRQWVFSPVAREVSFG
jgi:hypothetical protein